VQKYAQTSQTDALGVGHPRTAGPIRLLRGKYWRQEEAKEERERRGGIVTIIVAKRRFKN